MKEQTIDDLKLKKQAYEYLISQIKEIQSVDGFHGKFDIVKASNLRQLDHQKKIIEFAIIWRERKWSTRKQN